MLAAAVQHSRRQARPMAGDDSQPCRWFHWVGQPWTSCDRCGRPAWGHDGEWRLEDDDAPFVTFPGWEGRPWGPGEADAIKRKWGR